MVQVVQNVQVVWLHGRAPGQYAVREIRGLFSYFDFENYFLLGVLCVLSARLLRTCSADRIVA
jgi:hypothetical protein